MNAARFLLRLGLADVRERVRRHSFLATAAAALYLGYLVADGTIALRLGRYQGVLNAPWIGTSMAMCAITFVSLAGFYVVKNAIARDRATGVGQILAGTPVSRLRYLASKALGNFAVLAFVMFLLAVAAVALLFLAGEEREPDIVALLLPFLLLSLPAMAFVAALAVFFESTPGLRGGAGNVAYVFVWTALLAAPLETGSLWFDTLGVRLAMERIQADVRVLAPDYDGAFTIGVEGAAAPATTPLHWSGIDWSGSDIAWRMVPLAAALALVAASALFFDRFDTAPRTTGGSGRRASPAESRDLSRFLPGGLIVRLLALPLDRSHFGRMLLAEMRLAFNGMSGWWQIVALALWIVSVSLDPRLARENVLPWVCIWPLFVWSAMGVREQQHAVAPILFSCPGAELRQLAASWVAGAALAGAMAGGIVLRLLLDGEPDVAMAVLSGAILIPSLALALGVWSGGSTMFEATFVCVWLVGPLRHVPGLDFMATTDAAIAEGTPLRALALACVFLFLAFARRAILFRSR